MSYANMNNVPTQTDGVSGVLAADWNAYVRDNFDAIKYGHLRCTSSTRPTSVDEGTMVYETDTNKLMRYDGSSWVELVASGDDFSSTLGGQLGLNQTGTTRRVTASYATETTTNSPYRVLTGLTNFTIATPGEGVLRGIVTAELKHADTTNTAYMYVTALNGATNVDLYGPVVLWNNLNQYAVATNSYTIVYGNVYKKVSFLFEYIPTFYSSSTNSTFNVSYASSSAGNNAFIKNITFSAIWTQF